MKNSAPDDTTGERNFGLDVVRALAISLVLLAHFAKPLEILGIYGVEIFFVLSGYLIGGILLRDFTGPLIRLSDLSIFWRRRWYRTLPNYYLFFLVSLIWYSGGHSLADVSGYLIFLQNLAWPIGGFYEVSWSLAVEEWFYLLLPISVFTLNRLGITIKTAFILSIVIFVVGPLLLRLMQPPTSDWEHQTRMVVVYRLDALMYGVGLALVKGPEVWSMRLANSLLISGSALIGLSAMLLSYGLHSSGMPTATALVFSIIPVGVALAIPSMERIPRPRHFIAKAIQRISEWSYSIYLSHIPVIFAFYGFWNQDSLGFVGKFAVKVSALVAVIIISRFLYLYFELPITRLRPSVSVRQTANVL